MVDLLKMSAEKNRPSVGKEILSWVYNPQKSKQFILYLLGLLGAGLIFVVMYGAHFIPWLEKVPDVALYLLFLVIGPVLNYFRSLGKTEAWTLYDTGVLLRFLNKEKAAGEEKFFPWGDFRSCAYDSQGVTLIPGLGIRRRLKMRAATNVIAIYSICRERISIAQAARLEQSSPAPKPPNTAEQRRLAQQRRQADKRPASNVDWKEILRGK